ncbi:hypothetical protein OSTOST_11147 [Ostertagia ostertagi]
MLPAHAALELAYAGNAKELIFSMVIERAVALWKRQHYESYGPKLGIISAIVSIFVSFIAMAWAMQNDDFSTQSFYCSVVTENSANRLTILTYALCGIDLITMIGTIFLNVFNSYAMRRYVCSGSLNRFKKSFNQQSYQLRENANVIRVMLPLAVFQTICYMIFCFGYPVIYALPRSHVGRQVSNLCYVIPYYTVVSPILIWLIIRWSKQMNATKLRNLRVETKSEKDVYFQELYRVWNAVPLNK